MSKEAKVGLLLGLLFIVAIAVVLRGVHQNSSDVLAEQLAINGNIEASTEPTGDNGSFNLSKATDNLVDPLESPAFRRNVTNVTVDQQEGKSNMGSQATSDNANNEKLKEQPSWAEGQKRYEQELPRNVLPAMQEKPILSIGVSDAPRPQERYYTVQKDDSLWKIAQKELGSPFRHTEIQTLNNLPANHVLQPGQRLKLPRAGTEVVSASPVNRTSTQQPASPSPAGQQSDYIVKEGDSLWKIAQMQLGDGSRWPDIQKLNNLPGKDLMVGQKLRLPKK